jgi:predicted esterase
MLHVLPFLIALCASATSGSGPPARAELEARAPSADAPQGKVFESQSKDGLRYTWVLPKGYDGKSPRNLTVICHGTGLDYRWGHLNNQPDTFRPEDVVVSVDGPSMGQGDTRLFLGEPDDAAAMRAFLEELRALFAVRRVFLYGHSQGGFFVVYYAGEHPDTVAGVVAHASGAWNWSKMGKPVQKVAIAFMHGTLDPVVPYGQSPGSRDAYAKAGFDLLHLRRLENYNHWPNAVRATECLDWCEGMTTDDPAAALACARRLLTPKKADEYQWRTAVDFAGARDVLRRFEAKGKSAFVEAPAELAQAARRLAEALEEHASKHVAALRKDVAKKADLALAKCKRLGHLVSVREDFRGVDRVEAFCAEIGYDKALAAQAKAAGQVFEAWYGSAGPKEQYEAIVSALGDAFLVEGYPPELATRMDEWKASASDMKVNAKALKKHADFEAWRAGWIEGLNAYRKLWDDWKVP